MHKIYKSLNEAFVGEILDLKYNSHDVESRGSAQKELLFTKIELQDPSRLDITVPDRKFNLDYAMVEWLWYLSGDRRVVNIGKFAKIWRDIQDEYGCVESNYGSYLFPKQWGWVIEELSRDKDSRRATISINVPSHKFKNSLDYPCTHYLHFFIRENKLFMSANMRSNDAVFGFCNDVFTFCLFQQLMLNELRPLYPEIQLGSYFHFSGSFHIYSRHWSMMNSIFEKYPNIEYKESNRRILKDKVSLDLSANE